MGIHRILIYVFITAVSTLLCATSIYAQKDSIQVTHAIIVEGDTIPFVTLGAFEYSGTHIARSAKYMKRYGRIRKKVLKAYPYAKVTGELLANYESELSKLSKEKDKKEYLDLAEEELKEEFEGEIKNLTVSEGKILIKLIDRETGDSSYELIKKLKGSFSAFMYQSIARIFGSNLKSKYDATGDDLIIEEIVQQIERGEIYVPPKQAVTTKAQERLKRKERKALEKEKKRKQSMASTQ